MISLPSVGPPREDPRPLLPNQDGDRIATAVADRSPAHLGPIWGELTIFVRLRSSPDPQLAELSTDELRRALEFVRQVQSAPDLDAYRTRILGIRVLVPCDAVSYNEVNAETGELFHVIDPPEAAFPGIVEAFSRNAHQHPVIRHVAIDIIPPAYTGLPATSVRDPERFLVTEDRRGPSR